jgi:hypothetical protein
MEITDILKSKKIKVTEIPKWGVYLRKQWEYNFATHISHEEKKSIYLYDDRWACGFLWHLFSYEKMDCLKGGRAEKAFDHERKNACYVFYQLSDYALILENASLFTAKDLLNEADIYVVDKDFNWTFVRTGPYFSRKRDMP